MIFTTRALARGAWRAVAWLALGASLAACQSFDGEPEGESATAGWRVVERLGDARFLPPGAAPWTPAIAGSLVPAASRIATGDAGRVILARSGSQLSAGPGSHFTLPAVGAEARLEQEAGRLRFRLAGPGSETLAVRTPFLGILANHGVFEVLVSTTATEVTVDTGELRVVTPDGERQASLGAGQSVYATDPLGNELAVHLPHDRALEPAVLPAMRSRPDTPTSRLRQEQAAPSSVDQPGSEAAPKSESAPKDAPSASVAAKADVPPGNAAVQRHLVTGGPDEMDGPGEQAEHAAPRIDRPQSPFDRLTRGMVHGLPPAPPVPAPRPAQPSE